MRKKLIIQSAILLFGENGYNKSTTAMIAKHAGVSEALIFKHFNSKEGLLNYILKNGYAQVILENKGMFDELNPQELIHKVLDLPRNFINDNPNFWRMQARLIDLEICKAAHERFMQPVHHKLMYAFTELGYPNPKLEMEFLILIVESLWIKHAKNPEFQSREMIAFIKAKYDRTDN